MNLTISKVYEVQSNLSWEPQKVVVIQKLFVVQRLVQNTS